MFDDWRAGAVHDVTSGYDAGASFLSHAVGRLFMSFTTSVLP